MRFWTPFFMILFTCKSIFEYGFDFVEIFERAKNFPGVSV